jgi:hypothetical protein
MLRPMTYVWLFVGCFVFVVGGLLLANRIAEHGMIFAKKR